MSMLLTKPRVAFLGPEATYTHIAARQYFGESAEYMPMGTPAVCRSIRYHQSEFGVLPIENNYVGFVDTTLDALYATAQIQICDEIFMPVRHQLISKGNSLSEISRIYSHSQAFAQCRKTLERIEKNIGRRFVKLVVESTAMGAQLAEQDPNTAAIASEEAATKFGLNIVLPAINDRRDNTTRFWVLSLGGTPDRTGRDRTAFLVELEHRPGTLHRLLSLFADRHLNLAWVQTRPIGTEKLSGRWEYAFFCEFEGHIRDEPMAEVYGLLKTGKTGIQRHGRSARLIGSYPNRLMK